MGDEGLMKATAERAIEYLAEGDRIAGSGSVDPSAFWLAVAVAALDRAGETREPSAVEMVEVTRELIESGKTGPGGWKKEQVALLGISWPLKKGWIETVIGRRISRRDAEKFLSLKGRKGK
jgi:hypothetical protein